MGLTHSPQSRWPDLGRMVVRSVWVGWAVYATGWFGFLCTSHHRRRPGALSAVLVRRAYEKIIIKIDKNSYIIIVYATMSQVRSVDFCRAQHDTSNAARARLCYVRPPQMKLGSRKARRSDEKLRSC